jgi:DNA processing protein
MDIKIIHSLDEIFPDSLRKITNPPKCLYCRGNLSLLFSLNTIAIIGSRNCSEIGKEKTKELTSFLINSGFVIVSGLAKGIDTIAHQTAIDCKGKTIAVLGSGIDDASIYPKENLKLAMGIMESDGLIISEYKPGAKPQRQYFPKRNRLVVGLSQAVLATEVKEKSGTMITIRIALEQKKPVFVSLNVKEKVSLKKDWIDINTGSDIINILTKNHKRVN